MRGGVFIIEREDAGPSGPTKIMKKLLTLFNCPHYKCGK